MRGPAVLALALLAALALSGAASPAAPPTQPHSRRRGLLQTCPSGQVASEQLNGRCISTDFCVTDAGAASLACDPTASPPCIQLDPFFCTTCDFGYAKDPADPLTFCNPGPDACKNKNLWDTQGNGANLCASCQAGADSYLCAQCVPGPYTNEGGTCYPCSEGCAVCPDTVTCTTCADGYTKVGDSCTSSTLCKDASNPDAVPNCATCDPVEPFFCKTCSDGSTPTIDAGGFENCPTPGTDNCLSGPNAVANCAQCGTDVTQCVRCNGNLVVVNNVCVDPVNPPDCTVTVTNCVECATDPTVCAKCKPETQLVGNACNACPNTAGCQAFDQAANCQCATCDPGFTNNAGTCNACPAADKCLTWSAPGQTCQCTECANGWILNAGTCQQCSNAGCQLFVAGTCQCQRCEPGKVPNAEGVCEACPAVSNCAAFTPGSCTCQSCDNGWALIGNQCQREVCKDNVANCVECNLSNLATCTSCASGWSLVGNACVKNDACKTIPQCNTCDLATPNPTACIGCVAGWTWNTTTLVCDKNPTPGCIQLVENCVSCDSQDRAICGACADGFTLVTTQDGAATTCVADGACLQIQECDTCQPANPNVCAGCRDGFTLKGGVCIAACLTDASLGCSECNQLAPERCGACLDPSGVIDGSGKCRPQTCQEKFPTCGKCDVTGSYCVVCKRGCKCRSRPEWEHGGQYPGHDYKPYNPQPWKPAPQKPGHEYKPPLTWQHKPQQPGHDYNPHPIKWRPGPQRPGKDYEPYHPQQRPCPECMCPGGKCKGKGKEKERGKQQEWKPPAKQWGGQQKQVPTQHTAKPWGGSATMPAAQPTATVQQQQQQPTSVISSATQRWAAWWRQQQAGTQAVGQAKTAGRKCLTKKAGQSC